MKILFISDFRSDDPRALFNCPRKFSKGFIRNGHDVLQFSYRQMLLQHSPFSKKRLARTFGKPATNRLLLELARHYQPDIVLLAVFKDIDAQIIAELKSTLPEAVFMAWYGDVQVGLPAPLAAIAPHLDWFLATSSGELLQLCKEVGCTHCAFMPNPCDPDIEYRRPHDARRHCRLLFTGKAKHRQQGQDPMRSELIDHLVRHRKLTHYGRGGLPPLKGQDYLSTISNCDIAVSINAFNDIRLYHSDRLIQYLACGAFVLAKRVPDTELLFTHNKHLVYFDTIEQCTDLIDKYLPDEPARRRIAESGMARAHQAFHCQRLAGHIVDLATKGSYNETWAQII